MDLVLSWELNAKQYLSPETPEGKCHGPGWVKSLQPDMNREFGQCLLEGQFTQRVISVYSKEKDMSVRLVLKLPRSKASKVPACGGDGTWNV